MTFYSAGDITCFDVALHIAISKTSKRGHQSASCKIDSDYDVVFTYCFGPSAWWLTRTFYLGGNTI